MPELRAPADSEALVIGWLDDTLDVDVAGKVPSTFTAGDRFVRVFRIGGTESGEGAGYIDRPNLQVETFGADDPDAMALYAEVFLGLRLMVGEPLDGAVVTSVDRSFGPAYNPDEETGASRYLSGWIVTVHPTASGS